MDKERWHTKKIKRELVSQSFWLVFSVAFFLSTVMVWKILGHTYQFKTFEIASIPIWSWPLYSALTFAGPGAIIYKLKLYKNTYRLLKSIFGSRKAWGMYKDLKKIFWGILVLITFGILVPLFIKFLNIIITIGINIWGLIIYLLPIGVSVLIIVLLLTFLYKQNKTTQKSHP